MGSHFRTDIKLTTRLFNCLIKPILLYGSEVWGVDTKDNLNNDPIEAIQVKFCKMLLGVSRKASNVACRSELGMFPLRSAAKLRVIKFWIKFMNRRNDAKLSHNVITDSLTDNTHKTSWTEKIKSLLNKLGLSYMWQQNIDEQMTKYQISKIMEMIKQRIEDQEFQLFIYLFFLNMFKNRSVKRFLSRIFGSAYCCLSQVYGLKLQ